MCIMPIMPAAGLSHSPMLVAMHTRLWEEPVWSCHVSSWFSVVYLVLLIHRDWGGDMNGLNTSDRTPNTTKRNEGAGELHRASESFREREVRAAASSIAVILLVDNCHLPPATCHLLPATCLFFCPPRHAPHIFWHATTGNRPAQNSSPR